MSSEFHETSSFPYQYIFKLILIGDSNTGKTSLINRFVNDSFEDKFITTIGVDFLMKQIVFDEETVIKLQIWDTAGMEKYKNITSAYYRGAHGALVVFDLTNEESFRNVKKWVDNYCQLNVEGTENVYIIGNKVDLMEERVVKQDEINEYVGNNGFKYTETSAKTGQGVNDIFYDFVRNLANKFKQKGEKNNILNFNDNITNLNTKEAEKQEAKCCKK